MSNKLWIILVVVALMSSSQFAADKKLKDPNDPMKTIDDPTAVLIEGPEANEIRKKIHFWKFNEIEKRISGFPVFCWKAKTCVHMFVNFMKFIVFEMNFTEFHNFGEVSSGKKRRKA